MKRKYTLMSVVLLLTMIFTACSNNASIKEVINFDEEPDLSMYYYTEEAPEEDIVELKPTLEYVDTAYVMRLKSEVGEVSATRASYDEYPEGWNFVLVDSRPPAVFGAGHINGAINIPDAEFDKFASKLPENKDTTLIFYCGGWSCHLSANSAEKAKELGYKDVKVYQEGTPAWKAAGNYFTVSSEYVKEAIMESSITNEDRGAFAILDARPYAKYFEGHIPNAVFADDNSYANKFIGTAPQDKNTEIFVYCGGFNCQKSHTVADQLVASGYTNVKVYSAGLPEWSSMGLPTFGMEAATGDFNVSEGKVERGITPEKFDEMRAGANVQIIDVRSEAEVKGGFIPGSINIPDKDIHADPKAIEALLPADKNTTLLIHCAAGARAAGVVNKVADLGYPNTYYLNHKIVVSQDGVPSYE